MHIVEKQDNGTNACESSDEMREFPPHSFLRGRLSPGLTAPPTLTGFYLVDSLMAGRADAFGDALSHLVLPAFTLALGALATISRFTRAGVVETLQKDFVTYERAQGFPQRALIWKFVLRNSVVATVTQIGLLFGSLVAGAVVVDELVVGRKPLRERCDPGLRLIVQSLYSAHTLASPFRPRTGHAHILAATIVLCAKFDPTETGFARP